MRRHQRDEFGVLLRLLTVTGSCLGTNVLRSVFPQDLVGVDKKTRRPWRELWGEFEEKSLSGNATLVDTAYFCRGVFERVLGWDSAHILAGDQIPEGLTHEVPEHHTTLKPTWVLGEATNNEEDIDERAPWERILVNLLPADIHPEEIERSSRWKESPVGKMAALLRGTGHRVGIVTNGTHWVLVSAPPGGPDGTATWPSELMISEILLLRAFVSLLSLDRTVGSPEGDRLSDIVAKSVDEQKDVTEKLGLQVRRSVELFIQELDRADRERPHAAESTLQDVSPKVIYESAVTFLMRIVFLLCAEERKLLPIDQSAYSENYAASTLRESLEQVSDRLGPDVLELRTGAYERLLALFRLIHGGSDHPDLPMVAHGGGVFDPDRYPFLEGRPEGTSWRNTPAEPPAIDDRTILKILDALQLARERGEEHVYEVSFEALDVEQLGHVYECLLDHTAERAYEPILSLQGKQGDEPEIALSDLELWMEKGTLKKELQKVNGPTPKKVDALLVKEPTPEYGVRVRQRLGADADQWERVLPYTGLLRDVDGDPVIYPTGGLYVTSGTDRRNTGTNYTPRALTEPIVKTTLEVQVYRGPADGKPREEWQLKSATEILDLKVCDPACGSGAFLAETCRYLGQRLVEAWSLAEQVSEAVEKPTTFTIEGVPSSGAPDEHLLPESEGERELLARRLVAGRCLYGVDKNPIAAEMAKLSLWLLTMDQGRPFSFVDHAIRAGDSLVGLTRDQIEALTWEEVPLARQAWISEQLDASHQRRDNLIALGDHHAAEKHRLHDEARQSSREARMVGDYLIASFFKGSKTAERRQLLTQHQDVINEWRQDKGDDQEIRKAVEELRGGEKPVPPLHWEIEFPEVFGRENPGFDAMVGNPPFLGGKRISTVFGVPFRDWLASCNVQSSSNADLVAHFFRRCFSNIREGCTLGLIATNSIAQGDTRNTGLRWICENGGTIYDAESRYEWPGVAVVVSRIFIRKGGAHSCRLNGQAVPRITSFLFHRGGEAEPARLSGKSDKTFIGNYVLGMGFTFDDTDKKGVASSIAEMDRLIEKDPRNAARILPYLGGAEVNTSPTHSHHRYVINFGAMTEADARRWPDLVRILEERVRPERSRLKRKALRDRWWQFAEKQPALHAAIKSLNRILVISRLCPSMAFAFLPTRVICSEQLVVFALDGWGAFTGLQSRCHEVWARMFGGSAIEILRYSPLRCFETYPFPENWQTDPTLEAAGKTYYEFRAELMIRNDEGMTDTYNRFHDPDDHEPDIVKLRELHAVMDRAVLDAYGWDDISTDCEFIADYEVEEGKKIPWRYRWPEAVHDEVLARLLDLNQKRYQEEVDAGLHDKKKTAKKKTTKKKSTGPTEGSLFENEETT